MADYILDQSWHAERDRLDAMAVHWDPGTRLAAVERCGLGAGAAVLEVGAGAGSVTRMFAEVVGPTGRVTAVDLDTRFLADLDDPRVEVRELDLRTAELPSEAFDLVHARMVVEHLSDAKQEVLQRLLGSVRPGGWLFVEDLDWLGIETPWPPTEGLQAVIGPVMDFLAAQGRYDPHFGRTLGPVFVDLGLEEVSVDYRGGQLRCDPAGGVPPFDLFVAQLAPMMLGAGLVDQERLDALAAVTHDGSTFVSSPMMFAATGRRPLP